MAMTGLIPIRKKTLNYTAIQKAMEDVRRDVYDYYLDLSDGSVVTIPKKEIDALLKKLYHEEYEDDDERGVIFDSSVNTDVEIDHSEEAVVEKLIHVLTNPGRYVRIPERDSNEAFNTMRRFALTVDDPILRERLLSALNGKGAFNRFKSTLLSNKKERKRWHGFNARVMKEIILRWYNEVKGDGKT